MGFIEFFFLSSFAYPHLKCLPFVTMELGIVDYFSYVHTEDVVFSNGWGHCNFSI